MSRLFLIISILILSSCSGVSKLLPDRQEVTERGIVVVVRDTSGVPQCTVSVVMHIEYEAGLSRDFQVMVWELAETSVRETARIPGKWKLSGMGVEKGWYIVKPETGRKLILVEDKYGETTQLGAQVYESQYTN